MAVYPYTSSPYTNPVQIDIRYKTLVSAFDEEGEENRKQKWLYPKRDVTLKYQALSKSEGEILWEFYCGRKGSYGSFSWIESTGLGNYYSYSSEYVATGDSTTLIFSLPAKGSSGATHNVNLDGVAVSTSDYTISFGGGADGEDKVTFVAAGAGGLGPPGSTKRITYDFEGRLKIRCRFADDIYSFENFYDKLINSGVKLKGLLNL
jgi:hypothetical protein